MTYWRERAREELEYLGGDEKAATKAVAEEMAGDLEHVSGPLARLLQGMGGDFEKIARGLVREEVEEGDD